MIWRRQDTTRIISLTDAPRGFADLRSLDFEAMGRILFDGEDDAGRSVTVTGSFGTYSFLLDDPAAQKWPAVVIPIDPHYRSRCDEARRFVSHHLGFRLPARMPPVITPFRSLHLIRCLHAYDLHRAGVGERGIAAVLIDPRALTDHASGGMARSYMAQERKGLAQRRHRPGRRRIPQTAAGRVRKAADSVPKTLLCRLKGQKTASKLKTLHTTDQTCTQKDKARPRFVARRGRLFYLAFLFLCFVLSAECQKLPRKDLTTIA